MNNPSGILGLLAAAVLSAGTAWASGPGLMPTTGNAGTSSQDFGGVRLQPDQRGTTGTIYDYGAAQQFQFTSPTGEPGSGTNPSSDGLRMNPVVPLPRTPATPLYPLLPQGGGVVPHSNPGGSHWRGSGR
jgi:hypothetical protein